MPGTFLLAVLAVPLCPEAQGAGDPGAPGHEQCVTCHGQEGGAFRRGIHFEAEYGCTTCHGGRGDTLEKELAHGPDLKALGEPAEVLELCGGCHADQERMQAYGLRTDQLSLYWTSGHGQRFQADQDPGVATCVSCHGAHGILRPNDPRSPVHKLNQVETCGRCHADAERMAPYGLPAEAPGLYRGSVHGKALLEQEFLSSPACSDCHGSHGAKPPRVRDVGQVCGHCHTVAREYFTQGPHHQAVLQGLMEECISCHSNHGVQPPAPAMFREGPEGGCGTCHAGEDDPGLATAAILAADLERLDQGIRDTELAVLQAGEQGLFIEREHGYLDDARALRTRARALTHALSPGLMDDLLNRGEAMLEQTRESLDVKNRVLRDRKIYTGIFAGVTVMLILVLLSYRREITGTWREAALRERGGTEEMEAGHG